MSQQDNKKIAKCLYRASAEDLGKIPGNPVAYWLNKETYKLFSNNDLLRDISRPKVGLNTTDNNLYLRLWHEVDISRAGFDMLSREAAIKSGKQWFPYNKGGGFRRWYGNCDYFLNWRNDGEDIKNAIANDPVKQAGGRVVNEGCYFKPSISWSLAGAKKFSIRVSPKGFVFDVGGSSIFPEHADMLSMAAFLSSSVADYLMGAMNPTFNFQAGNVAALPIVTIEGQREVLERIALCSIDIHKDDWNGYETSWGFTCLSLVNLYQKELLLRANYHNLRENWLKTNLEMKHLEEENNRLFIDAYGLQDELTPEVPLSEITLTCNPHYRYGGNLTDKEREERLQSDTIAELISYAIGCMMGRYSLDREGLVYAHAANEGFKALVEEGAYATFAADEDGILPLTSDNWFPDDVAARFEAFIRTVWGAETLEDNLQFIADSLCLAAIKPVKKGGETARETIRRYLSAQFFKDHLKTYKKRPIYWLFSSGKEKAFECLVYLHRYNEATLPRMRTEYVTPLLGQMAGRIDRLRLQQAEAGTAEAKRIGKDIDSLTKQLTELRAFDDELKHHADMRITLDLDDGVKVNYGKFGTLLSDVKAITGDKGE